VGPIFNELKEAYKGKNQVRFVRLDFTNEQTTKEAEETGEKLGVNIYELNTNTAKILLLDGKNKSLQSTFGFDTPKKDIFKKIDEMLKN